MESAYPLRKFVNPEIVYGNGALALTGQYASVFNARKVLLVSDPGVVAAGWTGLAADSLQTAGIETILFSSVSPNPREYEVMSGAERYRTERCDAIVAVGGGSPLDCAKGIAIVSTNRCHILDFEGVDMVEVPMPPLICIPTTAGSSADVSQFAIINDTRRQVKIAIISKAVVPDVALIDPQTTTTMPPYLTACTGLDALVHAIEAYVSSASSPLTDLHALQAIRLIAAWLPKAIRSPLDPVARDRVMLASLEAGLAFSNASLGAVHAMAHSLGGLLDLPHGECNALLLQPVIRYNYPYAAERYQAIAAALGVPQDSPEALLTAIDVLREECGIAAGLTGRGVTAAQIPSLAEKAMQDPCMVTNPRRPTTAEIEEIYGQAL